MSVEFKVIFVVVGHLSGGVSLSLYVWDNYNSCVGSINTTKEDCYWFTIEKRFVRRMPRLGKL